VRATDKNFKVERKINYWGSPLRETKPLKPNQRRTSVAGKQKKKYSGRNSEGNRFIGNECL
jgi:hypothetical protein